MSTEHSEAVLLLHGLWMNRLVMQFLSSHLEQAGYVPHMLSYRSMQGTLSEHRRRLAECVAGLAEPCVHLVGHSMGGVIALDFLRQVDGDALLGPRIGRTLLLGSPVVDCGAARDFGGSGVKPSLSGFRLVAKWVPSPAPSSSAWRNCS